MFGAIVLRDVPKRESQIDLWKFEIKGGFRGFKDVMPGVHYVSVLDGDKHVGFWCTLKAGEVVVRIFKDGKFETDMPDNEAEFRQLASSGAMNHVLIGYPAPHFPSWFALTNYLAFDFPLPALNASDTGDGSRFESALMGTHQGDGDRLLAEFQLAFVSWLLDQTNNAALERWQHLLQAAYNAGTSIEEVPDYFAGLVPTLIAQLKLLPAELIAQENTITLHADYMIEDMIDTGLPELVENANEFRLFLENSRVS